MKKIVLLIAVITVLVCFSVTAFASNEAPFSFAADTIEVEAGEGTENVDVKLVVTFDEAATVGAFNITFDTDGLPVVGINSDQLGAYIPRDNGGSDIASGMITHIDMTNFATAEIAAGTKIEVVATLAVDKSVVKNYEITLTADTLFLGDDFETPINDGATYPTTTITVKEAKAPFVAETVEGAKVTSEVNEVTIGDAVYTNVAIFTATLGTGEGNYGEAGFIWVKDGNKTDNKYTVDAAVISGTGTFEYTAAMFAIENGVKIEAIPYYVTAE